MDSSGPSGGFGRLSVASSVVGVMKTSSRTVDKTRTSKAVGEYTKTALAADRKIQCTKSKHHGFHPENEACPDCPPPKVFTVLDVKTFGGGAEFGDDDDLPIQYINWPGYP